MMNSESSSVNGSVVISHYVAVPLPRNVLLFTELDSLFIIFCVLALGQLLRVHLILIKPVSGCIHIGTSMSPGTRVRVPVNTSLRVFQRWPFTVTQVLYEYELPVSFTRTSSFLTGRVFIQPVRCKQCKICIKIIYTCHDAHFTS